ncbi:hypothetical protein [Paralysiella testudinis]|uniref:Uncharacterized protein n=1 Tax=Paralysiella testudinis TaxID=2809020 RepID=A0A892ZCA3_9NEIS|nr:hypothetical protein [Paralysiella testudinis]QRQ80641.1 hypothetical protein JQU52_07620 [Paralysiella testudinis]
MGQTISLSLPEAYLPDLRTAEVSYPVALSAIEEYTRLVDIEGDESLKAYNALKYKLEQLVGKDLTNTNFYEWWEEEGIEVLSFRISLPDPTKTKSSIDAPAIREIVRFLTSCKPEEFSSQHPFANKFLPFLDDWFHKFLALNAKSYDRRWFFRQKDSNGNWFEHSPDALVMLLTGHVT